MPYTRKPETGGYGFGYRLDEVPELFDVRSILATGFRLSGVWHHFLIHSRVVKFGICRM